MVPIVAAVSFGLDPEDALEASGMSFETKEERAAREKKERADAPPLAPSTIAALERADARRAEERERPPSV